MTRSSKTPKPMVGRVVGDAPGDLESLATGGEGVVGHSDTLDVDAAIQRDLYDVRPPFFTVCIFGGDSGDGYSRKLPRRLWAD